MVKDAELAALAYLSFPRQQCLKIHTNNVMKRMNGKLNAEWECGRLFMSRESPEPVFFLKRAKMRIKELEADEEAHSEARVIMKLAIDKYERAA